MNLPFRDNRISCLGILCVLVLSSGCSKNECPFTADQEHYGIYSVEHALADKDRLSCGYAYLHGFLRVSEADEIDKQYILVPGAEFLSTKVDPDALLWLGIELDMSASEYSKPPDLCAGHFVSVSGLIQNDNGRLKVRLDDASAVTLIDEDGKLRCRE